MGDLPGASQHSKVTHSPPEPSTVSSSSGRILGCWLAWSCTSHQNCCGLLSVAVLSGPDLLHLVISDLWFLQSFCLLYNGLWTLQGRGVDAPFVAVHSAGTGLFSMPDQVWASALTAIYCKRKLLWRTENCTHVWYRDANSECSLILCPLIQMEAVGSLLWTGPEIQPEIIWMSPYFFFFVPLLYS